MGLVHVGSANAKAIDEMLQYAHETQHEKIIRGLAVGVALIMYGKEEAADVLIEQLCLDKVCFIILVLFYLQGKPLNFIFFD
jgi:26S proteasome regulatory subunit N2